jgi:hypothetical protein
MKPFWKKTTMDHLKSTLSALQLRAAALADKRTAAEAALAMATAARQQHRLDGDLADDKLDAKLQSNVDLCLSKLTGLDADIAALQAKITDTERQIADERAVAERRAASELLSRNLGAVEKALPIYLDAARQFTKALDELHHHFEASQMSAFVSNAATQVEVAGAFTLVELRGMVNAIAEGSAPVPPAKPVPAPVATVEPPPQTRTLFATHSLKWRENGRVRTAPAFEDVELPLELAERALRHGACVGLAHELRKTHTGVKGGYVPDPNLIGIVDLDAVSDFSDARHASFDPVASARITPFDRGPERNISIPALRAG